jgi:hypothetical protein
MDLLDLIEHELRAYRETGRVIHLAHAARALDAVCSQFKRNPESLHRHVEDHHTSSE